MTIGSNNVTGRVVEEIVSTKVGGRVSPYNVPQNGGAGGGGSGVIPYYHTLTSQNITDKHLQLYPVPTNLGAIFLAIVGGFPQNLGIDYTVNGSGLLNWNGLGMEAFLEAGDTIIILYM